MAQWLVGLNGSEADLALLGRALRLPGPQIIKRDEGYYLSSPTFDALPDDTAVREEAERLLPALNTGAMLHISGFAPMARGPVLRVTDDGPDIVFAEPIRIAGALHARLVMTRVDEHGQPQPTLLTRTMDLAPRDAMVAEACYYYTKEHTLFNLYKVWEAIRDDQGGREQGRGRHTITGKGWVTDDDWRRFDDAANVYDLSGEHARHRDVPPRHPHLPPMSLGEADRFIGTLMARWIEEKAVAAGL